LLQKGDFLFMPSIEGKELFSYDKLEKLRELLLPYRANIPLVRYGLEDMLRQLSMKRSCNETIFDYAVGSFVLGQFIAVFKSVGFKISGGVYPCFKDTDGFIRDVQRDLKEGLFGKTIIHPHQIELCDELYKVTKKQYLESLEILKSEKSVFSQNGKMVETKTMSLFAQEIVKRAEVYGLVEDKV
jgi:citrate lyase beta subunit